MKKVILGIACAFLLTACGGNEAWEYKVVKVAGQESTNYNPRSYNDPTGQLNSLGQEGWELVTSYTEVETVHPNFGNAEYVTGLQPKTRTAVVNFVYKRPAKKEK